MTKSTESKMNQSKAVRKFQAGLAVGRSDLARNGYAWMARNVAALVRLAKDEPNWLRGYRAALEDGEAL